MFPGFGERAQGPVLLHISPLGVTVPRSFWWSRRQGMKVHQVRTLASLPCCQIQAFQVPSYLLQPAQWVIWTDPHHFFFMVHMLALQQENVITR